MQDVVIHQIKNIQCCMNVVVIIFAAIAMQNPKDWIIKIVKAPAKGE